MKITRSTLMAPTLSLAFRISGIAAAAACALAVPIVALDGQPGIHDPSTVIAENGKYYVYATGGGLPMSISDDGWTWRRAGGFGLVQMPESALPVEKAGWNAQTEPKG